MTRKPTIAASVIALSLTACAFQDVPSESGGTWVGTITTEGNVTTVINESGSVWGGDATLVEEASIGVESGEDPYMLGTVSGVYAGGNEIFVLDGQKPALRVYDFQGRHLRDIGRQGQGPGEFEAPALLAVHPSGRVFVYDSPRRRVNVYTASGEFVDAWPLTISRCCAWPIYALGPDELWAHVRRPVDDPSDPRAFRFGVEHIGPDGPQGEATWLPDLELDQPAQLFEGRPFSAKIVWTAAPGGALLYGASDRYRFELLRPDGSHLIVERQWDPVPISAAEKEWQRQFAVAFEREYNDPGFSWDGADMPDHKPAYFWLGATLSGEVWVEREGPGERVRNCVENPIEAGYRAALASRCWRATDSIVDVFDADGRYLGEVALPPEVSGSVGTTKFVDAPLIVTRVEDEAGTIMVKRYRLVLPGEEGR